MTITELKNERKKILAEMRDVQGSASDKQWRNLKREVELIDSDILAGGRDLNRQAMEVRYNWDGSSIERTESPKGRYLRSTDRMADLDMPERSLEEQRALKRPNALGAFVKGKVLGQWEDEGLRQLALGSGSSGGFAVPVELSSEWVDLIRNAAVTQQAGVRTLPMSTSTVNLAKLSGDVTPEWMAENAAQSESDPTFDQASLTAKTLSAYIKCSLELFEDAPNVEEILRTTLTQSLAQELDRATLRGDGTGEMPVGIRNASNVVLQDKATAALSIYGDLLDGIGAARANNAQGQLGLITNPATFTSISKATAQDDQPLQAPEAYRELARFSTNQVPSNLGAGSDESEAYIGRFDQVVVGLRRDILIGISDVASDAFEKRQVHLRALLRADVAVLQPSNLVVIHGYTQP